MNKKELGEYLEKVVDIVIRESDENFKKYQNKLKEIYKFSKLSNHPTTRTGGSIYNGDKLISLGNNSSPSLNKNFLEETNKIILKNSHQRHTLFNHSERSCIYNAAKLGVSTNHTQMYMAWIPCFDCMCSILSSGIDTYIFHKQYSTFIHSIYSDSNSTTDWGLELSRSLILMKKAGIKLILIDGEIDSTSIIRGKEYNF